jgi:hypothetical protein
MFTNILLLFLKQQVKHTIIEKKETRISKPVSPVAITWWTTCYSREKYCTIFFYVLVGCLGDVAKFALQSEKDHVIRETVSHADVLEKVLLFIIVDRGQKQKVWSVNSLSNCYQNLLRIRPPNYLLSCCNFITFAWNSPSIFRLQIFQFLLFLSQKSNNHDLIRLQSRFFS